MFIGCDNLCGQGGTTYSEYFIDGEYARIDEPEESRPGYFTYIYYDEEW